MKPEEKNPSVTRAADNATFISDHFDSGDDKGRNRIRDGFVPLSEMAAGFQTLRDPMVS
jgi:hypothetical protein